MRFRLFLLFLFISLGTWSYGQGFVWGPKGGLSMGIQQWDNYQREPLFSGHGALYIESYSNENNFPLFAQIGYHVRGSALRFGFVNQQGNIDRETYKMAFNNIALILGAKQKFEVKQDLKAYYSLGLRGEYNLSTDVEIQAYENIDEFTNNIVAGFTVGGGLEYAFSDLAGAFIEVNLHPDFTNQVFVPPNPNARNPITNELQPHDAIQIKNISVELSIGFRFLRKVIYVDE